MIYKVHNYILGEFTNTFNVEFSTMVDGDDLFRKDEIDYDRFIHHFLPSLTSDVNWIDELEEIDLIDALNEYYVTNPLPEPQLL